MKAQPVTYSVTIGATTYTTTHRPLLQEILTNADLNMPLNSCRLVFAQDDKEGLAAQPDDAVTVKLGYGQQQETIFSGIVQSIDWGIQRTTVRAISSLHKLTASRINTLYEHSSAGDMVKDVAQSRFKLKLQRVESGLSFPVYALGDRFSAYDHIRTLAQQCGFDFYANSADKLVFARYQAALTHEVAYSNNLLRFTQTQPLTTTTGVEIYGESPASQGQGNQAYAWLTKKEVQAAAGKKSITLVRQSDPTARTQAIARKIAQATLQRTRQKARGQVSVLGDGAIRLGDAIKVSKLPSSKQNGTFKITGVTQRLSRWQGFCTDIAWEEI
ncbi:MAG: hypothetical protein AAFO84_14005 [Cyanobacteria bacterium J06598_1]